MTEQFWGYLATGSFVLLLVCVLAWIIRAWRETGKRDIY